ncbi:MAG: phosphonate ABC transporter ATP-binding protein [Ardenticatenaceae bacterium]|nr:phosphonate ABC transporter ATP-binding protein [Ardenticatenaceae bacterium]
MAPAFKLHQVSVEYSGFPALNDISLTIHRGERIALVGPSGAGKTTLLHLLNGLLQPTSGTVEILGDRLPNLSISQRRSVHRQIGTIYQQFHLVGNLRVIHNVNAGQLGRWSLAKSLLSLIWPQQVDQAQSALAKVGIPEKLLTRTDQLSGGQQQRVAIARVLVQDPAVILADEPIASLDPERSRQIMRLLADLAQTLHKTLVVSVHEIEYAMAHCDRLIGLREGKIVFDQRPERIQPSAINALYAL